MADFIFPSSVGGNVDIAPDQTPVEPIESRISDMVLPASVGGVAAPEPIQQQQIEPVQAAQPLSELAPAAIKSFRESVAPLSEARQDITEQATGIADIFTGSERIAATPELGEVPEFAFTPESESNISLQLGMLSTFDEKAQLDIIKEAIPEAKFDTTPDGSTFIEVPDGKGGTRRSVLNRPGMSPQDLITASAQILAFINPAKLANLGKSLLKKFGIGGAAAGATEQALQEFGVEQGRTERDPLGTGIDIVTGGAGELIAPAVQAVRQGRQAAKVGAESAEIEAVREAIEPALKAIEGLKQATGVEVGLFRGQGTLLPSDLLDQRILAQLDGGAKIAAVALNKQNKEISEATTALINSIAPEGRIVGGARRVKEIA